MSESDSSNTDSLKTSSQFLRALCCEDPDAWNRFADLYTPLVYCWSRRAGLQSEDASDAVQEVFAVVASRLYAYHSDRGNNKFRGWLWGISRNVIRRHYVTFRKKPIAFGGAEAHTLVSTLPEMLDSEEPPQDPAAEESLLRRALMSIRSDFKEKTWQAFWRLAIENEPAAMIGQDLGMTAKAVRQAKYRVLCRLREELNF